jgi:Psq-like protein
MNPTKRAPRAERDWEVIRAAVVGGLSTRAAAAKFNVPYATLRRRAAAEGWCKDREQIGSEVRAKIDEGLTTDLVARARAANQDGDRVAGKIEAVVEVLAGALATEAQKAAADGKRLSALSEQAAALATAHARTHKTRRLALGLDKEGDGAPTESPLQAVLRRMRESGKIAAPVAVEPGGASGSSGAARGAGDPDRAACKLE